MLRIVTLILGLIVTINAIWTTIKWKKSSLIKKIFALLSVVVVLITAYYAWTDFKENEKVKKIESKVGELKALNNYKDLRITFAFGTNVFYESLKGDLQFPGNTKKGKYLKAWINDDKLFLSVVIRNQIDEIIATIEGQTWKVYNIEYDYNNDDKGFEIVTPDKKVVFQIFLKDHIVHIRGLILSDQKFGYYVYNDPTDKGAMLEIVDLTKKTFMIPDFVPKIFMYPRETNYGVRDFNNPLNK